MKSTSYKTLLASIVLLSLGQSPLFSQLITLKGHIVDETTGESLVYANVVLSTQDSVFVMGSNSDHKGDFILSEITLGDYLLTISYIGYENNIIQISNLSVPVDLGEIFLQPDTQLLDEVVVQGSNTIYKVDRQVILPSAIQVKSSNSGFELLNNMMISGLRIDPIQNTITSAGNENVQVRINDVLASIVQIKALRPSSVLRVEYINDPGVRYGDENLGAVVNFIVKRQESGLDVTLNLDNAPFVGFANDLLSIRGNHKMSEFGFDYFLNYRNYQKRYSDKEERYEFPSEIVGRQLQGIEQPFSYTDHMLEASYNLTNPDKYVFHAVLKDYIHQSPNNDFSHRILYDNPETPDATSRQLAVENANMPSIDLYYNVYLPKKQSITLNMVGTMINTQYDRSYYEYQDTETTPEFAYSVKGEKYSFIGEGLYDKEFTHVKLTSGVRYSQSYTENLYTGSTEAETTLRNSSLYVYSQLQGQLAKVNYQLGLGLSYSKFSEETDEYDFLTFQPIVSLSYSFLKTSFLRYRFSITPLLPSLSSLSDIRQDLDAFRVNVGNPNLKPYRRFQNALYYQFKQKLFTGTFSGTYSYYKNPIMNDVFREDGDDGSIFVYTLNNQNKFQRLGANLSLSLGPIKDIVSIIVEGGMNRYFSTGNDYYHQYTNWYIGAGIQATYKNWIFYTTINTRENSLYGETITMGEALNNAGLFYSIKNCRIGLSMLYPYSTEWKAGSEDLSDLAYSKSWTHIKENGRMLILNFTWSVNYGKKHQSGQKVLNNSDTDAGIVK